MQRAGGGRLGKAVPPPASEFYDGALIVDGFDQDQWPDDWDAIPRWRVDEIDRLTARGFAVQPFRSRREYMGWVDRCRAALEDGRSHPASSVALTVAPDVSAAEAAAQFLEHLQQRIAASGQRAGRFTHEDLSAAYDDLCIARSWGSAPAENTMRDALSKLPGVTKQQISIGSGRARRRNFVWSVAVGETSTRLRRAA